MTTLNELLNFPFTNKIDISNVPVAEVMTVLRNTYGNNPYSGSIVSPESEALEFYMANHVIALIRTKTTEGIVLTDVNAQLVKLYSERTSNVAVRAFAYLLLICTREMRHLVSASALGCEIINVEMPVFYWIKNHVKDTDSASSAKQIWSGDIPFNMGEYTTVLEKMFRKGTWSSDGFGGPAWAEVTKCLRDYVNGTLTAEMMVDTVWTLCHNNGPIFNKGMLYHSYTPEIYRILDVQRAGQVPQYQWSEYLTSWYSKFMNIAALQFSELTDDPNLEAIKATAVHPDLWVHVKIDSNKNHVVKPSNNHGVVPITTQKVESKR